MLALQRLEVAGQRFVLLPETEYDRLCAKAGEMVSLTDDDLPPLPKPDKQGRFPAVEYARVSLARDLIRDRRAAGLTQQNWRAWPALARKPFHALKAAITPRPTS